jgi:hypothetical protein
MHMSEFHIYTRRYIACDERRNKACHSVRGDQIIFLRKNDDFGWDDHHAYILTLVILDIKSS